MAVEEQGATGPRWPTISAIALTLTLGVPMTLWGLAGSDRTPPSVAMTVPVMRAEVVAADRTAPAAPVDQPPQVAEMRLDARALLDVFRSQDYRIEDVRAGGTPVPRVRLVRMPRDIGAMDSLDARKDLFLKTMLPLVLLANERIEKDRARLQRLHDLREAGRPPSPQDQKWLAQLADRYGLEGNGPVDTRLLLRRVDIVPVSLTLAQAAEESGWGTSRFAQQGNALFGQLTWSSRHKGIVPRNRQPGERHRFRSFDELFASVQSYMHNLNTHQAYLDFRRQRAHLRQQGKPLDGAVLAAHIGAYSERGADYVAALRRLIRVNDLHDFDRATLLQEAREVVLHVAPAGKGQKAAPVPISFGLSKEAVPPAADKAETAPVQTEDGAY